MIGVGQEVNRADLAVLDNNLNLDVAPMRVGDVAEVGSVSVGAGGRRNRCRKNFRRCGFCWGAGPTFCRSTVRA